MLNENERLVFVYPLRRKNPDGAEPRKCWGGSGQRREAMRKASSRLQPWKQAGQAMVDGLLERPRSAGLSSGSVGTVWGLRLHPRKPETSASRLPPRSASSRTCFARVPCPSPPPTSPHPARCVLKLLDRERSLVGGGCSLQPQSPRAMTMAADCPGGNGVDPPGAAALAPSRPSSAWLCS